MRAVDEARLVAREKQRSSRHLLRLANAALLNGKGRIRHVDAKLVEIGNLAQTVLWYDKTLMNKFGYQDLSWQLTRNLGSQILGLGPRRLHAGGDGLADIIVGASASDPAAGSAAGRRLCPA